MMLKVTQSDIANLPPKHKSELGRLVRLPIGGVPKSYIHGSLARAMHSKGILADVQDRWIVRIPWREAYMEYFSLKEEGTDENF